MMTFSILVRSMYIGVMSAVGKKEGKDKERKKRL